MFLSYLCTSKPSAYVADEEVISPDSPVNIRLLPFDVTPFGRLPNELLLNILDLCITRAKDVVRLSSICVYLRNVALNEGRLWSNIDLRRCTTSSISWAIICTSRAGDASLSVLATEKMLQDPKCIASVLPYAAELDLEVVEGSLPNGERAIPQLNIDRLSSLTLRGFSPGQRQDSFSTHVAVSLMCSSPKNLQRLFLYGGTVDELPVLPQLEHFGLQSTRLSSRTLYDLMKGSAHLVTLSIQSQIVESTIIHDGLSFLASVQPVSLPRLRQLKLMSGEVYATALLRVLPNPSHQLEIIVRPQNSVTPAQFNDLATITARIKHHWQTHGGGLDLPEGHLLITMSYAHHNAVPDTGILTFGHKVDAELVHAPSLYFSAECFLHGRNQLAILDSVQTLELSVGYGIGVLPFMLDNSTCSLLRLASLRKLIIRYASFIAPGTEIETIFSRRTSVCLPQISLELHQCSDEWHIFGSRLHSSGLIANVTISS
jgi:hypothetical protein